MNYANCMQMLTQALINYRLLALSDEEKETKKETVSCYFAARLTSFKWSADWIAASGYASMTGAC